MCELDRSVVCDRALQRGRVTGQPTCRHCRAATIGVGAGQRQRAGAGLGKGAVTAHHAAKGQRIAIGINRAGARAGDGDRIGQRQVSCVRFQRRARRHRKRACAQRRAVANLDRAGIKGGAATVGVGAGQRQRAAVDLVQGATAHNAAKGQRVAGIGINLAGASDGNRIGQRLGSYAGFQRRARRHRERACAQRRVVADLDRASTKAGAAGVCIRAGQRQRAAVGLGQATCAGHCACICACACLCELDRSVVHDRALQRGRVTCQTTCRHRRAACIAVGAAKRQSAGAGLGQGATAHHATERKATPGSVGIDSFKIAHGARQAGLDVERIGRRARAATQRGYPCQIHARGDVERVATIP